MIARKLIKDPTNTVVIADEEHFVNQWVGLTKLGGPKSEEAVHWAYVAREWSRYQLGNWMFWKVPVGTSPTDERFGK